MFSLSNVVQLLDLFHQLVVQLHDILRPDVLGAVSLQKQQLISYNRELVEDLLLPLVLGQRDRWRLHCDVGVDGLWREDMSWEEVMASVSTAEGLLLIPLGYQGRSVCCPPDWSICSRPLVRHLSLLISCRPSVEVFGSENCAKRVIGLPRVH